MCLDIEWDDFQLDFLITWVSFLASILRLNRFFSNIVLRLWYFIFLRYVEDFLIVTPFKFRYVSESTFGVLGA